jgi:hypothetical protein
VDGLSFHPSCGIGSEAHNAVDTVPTTGAFGSPIHLAELGRPGES